MFFFPLTIMRNCGRICSVCYGLEAVLLIVGSTRFALSAVFAFPLRGRGAWTSRDRLQFPHLPLEPRRCLVVHEGLTSIFQSSLKLHSSKSDVIGRMQTRQFASTAFPWDSSRGRRKLIIVCPFLVCNVFDVITPVSLGLQAVPPRRSCCSRLFPERRAHYRDSGWSVYSLEFYLRRQLHAWWCEDVRRD